MYNNYLKGSNDQNTKSVHKQGEIIGPLHI